MNKNAKAISGSKTAIIIVVIIVLVLVVVVALKGSTTGEATSTTQCNDRIDNDGDARCDYSGNRRGCTDGSTKGDTGCSSGSDNTEASCVPGSTTCGVGECRRTSTCIKDAVSCTPGSPVAEVCGDGKDNDCNGVIDNGCGNPDSCTDSDGGWVITVQGTASGYKNNVPYSKTDFCLTNTTISEYYCVSSTSVGNLSSNCPNPGNVTSALCSNGRCM